MRYLCRRNNKITVTKHRQYTQNPLFNQTKPLSNLLTIIPHWIWQTATESDKNSENLNHLVLLTITTLYDLKSAKTGQRLSSKITLEHGINFNSSVFANYSAQSNCNTSQGLLKSTVIPRTVLCKYGKIVF